MLLDLFLLLLIQITQSCDSCFNIDPVISSVQVSLHASYSPTFTHLDAIVILGLDAKPLQRILFHGSWEPVSHCGSSLM